jgi:hypothetical protein
MTTNRPEPILAGDNYVECSDHCPFVIHEDDWSHHIGWHAEQNRRIGERYPSKRFDGTSS